MNQNRKITRQHKKKSNRTQNHTRWASRHLEQNIFKRQLVILQDAQIQKQVKDKLSFLQESECDSTIYKFSTDVGKINLFEMNIPAT